MKSCLIRFALLAAGLTVSAQELSDEQLKLQKDLSSRVKIGTILNNTLRDDADKKYELFKFYTYQDERDTGYHFRMRVTVQLTDQSGSSCFAQLNRAQGPVDTEYTGEDVWEFHIPHGEMQTPKVSAYAIQYGILDDGVFIPLTEKLYRIKSVDEITADPACRIEFTQTLHYYKYREDGEVVSSNPN